MASYDPRRDEEQREPAGTPGLSALAAINSSMGEITLCDQPEEGGLARLLPPNDQWGVLSHISACCRTGSRVLSLSVHTRFLVDWLPPTVAHHWQQTDPEGQQWHKQWIGLKLQHDIQQWRQHHLVAIWHEESRLWRVFTGKSSFSANVWASREDTQRNNRQLAGRLMIFKCLTPLQ